MDYEAQVFGMFGGRDNYVKSIEEIVDFAQIVEGEAVLELGCGTGISTSKIMEKTTRVTAVELNSQRMRKARGQLPKGAKLLQKDARDLTKRNGQYDVVMCINGFHYFKGNQFYEILDKMMTEKGRAVFNVKLESYANQYPSQERIASNLWKVVVGVRRAVGIPPSEQYIDKDWIKSTIKGDTFFVPEKFTIKNKAVKPTYLSRENMREYQGYWTKRFRQFLPENALREAINAKNEKLPCHVVSGVGFAQNDYSDVNDFVYKQIEMHVSYNSSYPPLVKADLVVEVERKKK